MINYSVDSLLQLTKKHYDNYAEHLKNSIDRHDENEYRMAFDELLATEECSEKLVVEAREAINDFGLPKYDLVITNNISSAFPFECGYTKEGWFCMKMPRIPSIKSKRNALIYLRDTLIYLLQNAVNKGLEKKTFEDCVIVYRNIYSPEASLLHHFDNDNLEYRAVNNVLVCFFLPDDNPEICDQYMFSCVGETNSTEVYIIPKKNIIDFFVLEKNNELDNITLNKKAK